MPTYEYECPKCGTRFEQFFKLFSQNKAVKCPNCGDEKPVRVVSSFASRLGGDSCAPRGGG